MTVADRLDLAAAQPADDEARAVFGSRLSMAQHYAELLATAGVERGLLGPRESGRLWARHLINCAVVTELLPDGARVVDVGSGAGLPGLTFAVRRSDLSIDLVESMQRRVAFLDECVAQLELDDSVRVTRGRVESAEVISSVGQSSWVTARAVAPLDRLVGWCLPLLDVGGRLLALKGERSEVEVREYAKTVQRLGGVVEDIVRCGEGLASEPTKVVVVRRVR